MDHVIVRWTNRIGLDQLDHKDHKAQKAIRELLGRKVPPEWMEEMAMTGEMVLMVKRGRKGLKVQRVPPEKIYRKRISTIA